MRISKRIAPNLDGALFVGVPMLTVLIVLIVLSTILGFVACIVAGWADFYE